MDIFVRFIGALVITYFVRIGLLRMFARRTLTLRAIVLANAISFAVCFAAIGLIKHALTVFNQDAALFYLLPQAVWLVFDILRTRGGARRK